MAIKTRTVRLRGVQIPQAHKAKGQTESRETSWYDDDNDQDDTGSTEDGDGGSEDDDDGDDTGRGGNKATMAMNTKN